MTGKVLDMLSQEDVMGLRQELHLHVNVHTEISHTSVEYGNGDVS